MPHNPRFLTVAERQAALGPSMPAPERYIDKEGYVRYNVGDPVPLGEARAIGWLAPDEEPLKEPEPINASARGRKIRLADRDSREQR